MAAAIAVPQVLVLLSSFVDVGVGGRMQANVSSAAAEVSSSLSAAEVQGNTKALAALIDEVARARSVRIRVVERSGVVAHDADHEAGSGWLHRAGDFFFGSAQRRPSLKRHEEQSPPLPERADIRSAFESGVSDGCADSPNRQLLVCHAARALPVDATEVGARLVYVQESSRRAIRALFQVRYELLKLSMFSLPIGLLLAFWLSGAVVGPVAKLRDQALALGDHDAATHKLDSGSHDEIGDLAAAFNGLLTRLAERSQQNEAFVADLAHEFKNPVAAIRAAADKLASSEEVNVERAGRLARILLRSSSKLDRLVSEFLELARAEAGLPSEERVAVDLGELLSGLLDTLRTDERFQGVVFLLPDAESTMAVVASQQLERALVNLLENAASYAGAAGIAGAAGKVTVALHSSDGHAVVAISDDGPGIDPEALPRVFDRFFTTRADSRGTGLGLALAKAVVEAHGGSLRVDSSPNEGATFTLRLPFTSDSQ